MSSSSIVIASAGRTAVGSFNGAFATVPAHELGAAAVKGALERAGIDALALAGNHQAPDNLVTRQAVARRSCPAILLDSSPVQERCRI